MAVGPWFVRRFVRCVIVAGFALSMTSGEGNSNAEAADGTRPLPYGKPLYAKDGAPICMSRQGLSDFLDVYYRYAGMSKEEKAVAEQPSPITYYCFFAPDGFGPMITISSEGMFDPWISADYRNPKGRVVVIWTVLQMLRN
jgi:hypothetical protein